MLAGHVDGLGGNLQEGIRLPIAHRTRADTIDIDLQESIPRLRLHDKGDAIKLTRGKLGDHNRP